MRTSRVYCDCPLALGESFSVIGDEFQHLAKVLRIRPGQEFIAFNGSGIEARARVLSMDRSIEATVVAVGWPQVEAQCRLSVYLAVVKGERFDWAVEKLTELGVARIVPIATQFTQVTEVKAERLRRWRRLACEASGQSKRVCVPVIEPLVDYASAVKAVGQTLRSQAQHYAVMCVCGENTLACHPPEVPEASLFIGPEGGFSTAEVDLAQTNGLRLSGLGPRVLRVETAALVAASMLLLP